MPRLSSPFAPGSFVALSAALLLSSACSSPAPAGTPGTAGTGSPGAAGTNGSAGASGGAGTGPRTPLVPPWPDGAATNLWTLAPATPPATVAYTAQAAAKVVKEVPVTGGTLKATAADGTTFELTVPGDALFAAETIAMTPVTITMHPFSADPAWGVQLLPDGLTFNKPVTLVITPPTAAPPVDQQVPFGWSGAGNEAFLANPDPKSATLTMKLLHFSSYAYATARQGMSSSLAGVRNRLGGSAETRIQSAVAELLGRERQAALLGSAQDGLLNGPEIAKLFEEWETEVVQVRIAAAGDSCAAGRLAIQTVLGTERQKQLLGYTGGEGGILPPGLADTVANVCIEEEWALCRDHHIIQRLVPFVLGLERQDQLLGGELAPGAVMKALGYVYKCFQYELDVTSTVGNVCDQWTFSEPVQGKVKIKLPSVPTTFGDVAAVFNVEGVDKLYSQSYSMKYKDNCTGVANIVPIDPRFTVTGLFWSVKSDPTAPGNGEIKDFTLPGEPTLPMDFNFLVSGSTHETRDLCGIPPAEPQTIPEFNWWSVFVVTLGENAQYFNDLTGWSFTNWMVYNDGGPLLAKKVIDEKVVDGEITYSTATTFLLTHKPAN